VREGANQDERQGTRQHELSARVVLLPSLDDATGQRVQLDHAAHQVVGQRDGRVTFVPVLGEAS
jgi:hypothetical protein